MNRMKIKRLAIAILGSIGAWKIRAVMRNRRSKYYLKRNAVKIKGTDLVRVAFLVYEPAMWDKLAPVYLELLENPGTEPYLIVVPDVGLSTGEVQKKKNFFVEKYENIILYDESTVERFRKKEFQYTFYQTPYGHKFPKDLQAYRLVKYTKICYIPYGYVGSSDFFAVSSNEEFFSNTYFGFMDNEDMETVLQKKFFKECRAGIQHFLFAGYPPFEYYCKMDKSAERIQNILWLPRWTYAQKGGGSHFLEYKDQYNNLAADCLDMKLAMRPHPLMFTSLVEQGLLSEEEVVAYKKDITEKNVHLDEHSLLNDTLSLTDLMIADYSSVIIMYFLSGRPIIYCDGGLPLTDSYAALQNAMYVARSWQEVVEYVEMLRNGEDPLKEQRLKIAEEAGKKHLGAAKRIVNIILSDYRN